VTTKKYSIIQIAGGLGKHIALTAGVQAVKNNFPDREIVAVVAWTELFTSLPEIHRVYPLNNTHYFYDTYIKDQDSIIFAQEVYMTTPHILKQKPMIESWCNMYNITYNNEQPKIKINPEQKRAIRSFYEPLIEGKEVLLIHTNGGLFKTPNSYCWARDIPFELSEKITRHFTQKGMFVIQVAKPTSPEIPGAYVRSVLMSNFELCGLLELSNKRLLIDSSLQHAAAALRLPSVVLWNATSPEVFGHSLHTNIKTKQAPNISLPGSYLFDFQFDSNENEFPYEEADMENLYDVDEIIHLLEKD
jgi:ADP-heptose:LPS heptosyltransferase